MDLEVYGKITEGILEWSCGFLIMLYYPRSTQYCVKSLGLLVNYVLSVTVSKLQKAESSAQEIQVTQTDINKNYCITHVHES